MEKRLPELPSDLIKVALGDIERVEADSRYRINMGVWHSPIGYMIARSQCEVCFAGAVIAKTLVDETIGPYRQASPSCFSAYNRNRLVALDFFRLGRVYEGACEMGYQTAIRESEETWDDRTITSYYKDPSSFKRCMHKMANDLKKAGL